MKSYYDIWTSRSAGLTGVQYETRRKREAAAIDSNLDPTPPAKRLKLNQPVVADVTPAVTKPPLFDVSNPEYNGSLGYDNRLVKGDRIVALIRRDFRTMGGWAPRSWQYDMLDFYMGGLLQYIYHDVWESMETIIIARHNETCRPKALIMTAARREGKTAAVTLLIALAIVHASDSIRNILVTAQAHKQAKNFTGSIAGWVTLLEERYGKGIIHDVSATTTTYWRTSSRGANHDPTTSIDRQQCVVWAVAAGGIGCRGESTELIVADEFFFSKCSFLERHIVPMLREQHTTLFALSSLSYNQEILELFGVLDQYGAASGSFDPDCDTPFDTRYTISNTLRQLLAQDTNHMSTEDRAMHLRAIKKHVSGRKLGDQNRFLHVRNWCGDCLSRVGYTKTQAVDNGACEHHVHRINPDYDDIKYTTAMLGKNKATVAREMWNIPETNESIVFHASIVDAALSITQVRQTDLRNTDIILFFDPTNGTRSRAACIGLAPIPTRDGKYDFEIVMIAEYTIEYDTIINKTTNDMAQAIAAELRRDPRFQHSTLYTFIENNASHGWVGPIIKAMSDAHPCVVRMQYINGTNTTDAACIPGRATDPLHTWKGDAVHDGVCTTQVNKHQAVQYTLEMLKSGRLRMAAGCPILLQGTEDIDLHDVLKTQLKAIQRHKSNNGRLSYSGKSSGVCDDIAICLIMALFWVMTFLNQVINQPNVKKVSTGQCILVQ